MERKVVCIDTSVIIDYYRKKNKSKTLFFELTKTYSIFVVSAITEYEIFIGNLNTEQEKFWTDFFERIIVLPLDSETVKFAVEIYRQLKSKNKLIDIPDILIAASAIKNNVSFATLNKKHFERIELLKELLIA